MQKYSNVNSSQKSTFNHELLLKFWSFIQNYLVVYKEIILHFHYSWRIIKTLALIELFFSFWFFIQYYIKQLCCQIQLFFTFALLIQKQFFHSGCSYTMILVLLQKFLIFLLFINYYFYTFTLFIMDYISVRKLFFIFWFFIQKITKMRK